MQTRRIRLLATALLALALPATVIAQHPARTDVYGNPLPDGAVARLGTVRFRHTGKITFAAFLPNGKSAVSAGADQTIRVWEYPSGKELRRIGPPAVEKTDASALDPYAGSRIPVALSEDRSKLAACFDGVEVILFDAVTGKELHKFKASGTNNARGGVVSLSFAPKSTCLAIVNMDGGGHIWDYANGKELCSLADTKANTFDRPPLWCLDGNALVTTRAEAIDIWNATNGRKTSTVSPKDSIWGLISSPNGKELVYREIRRFIVIDVATGKEIRRWDERSYMGTGPLLFSPDGVKLYGRSSENKALIEWNPISGDTLRIIGLARSAPNGYGTVGDDCAAWSPDGCVIVLAGGGSALQFVDVAAGKEIGPAIGVPSIQSSVRFTPDGKYVWSRNIDGTVHKWDAATSKIIDLPALSKTLWQGPGSPDGKLLVGSSTSKPPHYGVAAFLDAATGKERSTFSASLAEVNRHMVFSPDGNTIALHWAKFKKLMLHQVPTSERLHTLPTSGNRQAAVFFSPDSHTLAVLADAGALTLWDVVSGRRIAVMPLANGSQARSGAFSPDGRCVAIDFKDGTAAVYEVASGQARRTFGNKRPLSRREMGMAPDPHAPMPEPRVALGDRGQTLVYADFDRTIRVWDVDTGKELIAFTGHTDSVEAVALSLDGKTLASASADTTILLWDMTRVKRPTPVVKALSQSECDACWRTLLDADAVKAFAAICDLSASPKATLTHFKERVNPSPRELQRVEELLAALGSDQFKTRQNAMADLLKLDERAVPAIDKKLANNPSLETKRRLEVVRQKLSGAGVLNGERLRMHRVVEILERIGTPKAREMLYTLADGAPGTSLTASAQTALQRLAQVK